MAIIINTLAQNESPNQLIGSEINEIFSRTVFTIPFIENKSLKIIEYATSEVTAGKNIAIRKKPLNFKVASFNNTDKKRPSTIIIGTCTSKKMNVFLKATMKVGYENARV